MKQRKSEITSYSTTTSLTCDREIMRQGCRIIVILVEVYTLPTWCVCRFHRHHGLVNFIVAGTCQFIYISQPVAFGILADKYDSVGN